MQVYNHHASLARPRNNPEERIAHNDRNQPTNKPQTKKKHNKSQPRSDAAKKDMWRTRRTEHFFRAHRRNGGESTAQVYVHGASRRQHVRVIFNCFDKKQARQRVHVNTQAVGATVQQHSAGVSASKPGRIMHAAGETNSIRGSGGSRRLRYTFLLTRSGTESSTYSSQVSQRWVAS